MQFDMSLPLMIPAQYDKAGQITPFVFRSVSHFDNGLLYPV